MASVKLFSVRLNPSNEETGRTRHIKEDSVLPRPVSLEIAQEDSGFFLYYLDEAGCLQTDTWHQSLDAAFEQAQFEFSVLPKDWIAES